MGAEEHLGVQDGGVSHRNLGTHDVGTKQRQAHQSGRADAEALRRRGKPSHSIAHRNALPCILLRMRNMQVYDCIRAVRSGSWQAEYIVPTLPMAAVVLPAASRASVRERMSSPMAAISAMPPALSAMGP